MTALKVANETGIKIEYERDALLDDYARNMLGDRYMVAGETSPQDAFARAAVAFSDDVDHAQRLYDAASKMWFMFATPVLANGGTDRGLPISCFLNHVSDSRSGLNIHYAENNMLASHGGGLGCYWGALRTNKTKTSSGGESTGMIPFLKVVDSATLAFRQGGTRRAAYAAYLDVSHPEIVEFLNIRKPTGGDLNRKCLNLHHGVNISDKFMRVIEQAMMTSDFKDDWELIDPHTKEVKEVVSAKELWTAILETRVQTGEPYIHFVDTSNYHLPLAQQVLGLKVNGSNLCSEIVLPTDSTRTAVCCLSSVNLEKYDEWKDTSMVADIVRMLDNVLDSFIEMPHVKPEVAEYMARARNSAQRERSIGLGAMGFHAYLQSKGVAFESPKARKLNREMFSYIRAEADKASHDIAKTKGYAPDFLDANRVLRREGKAELLKTTMRRNMHLMAIAPNASSSILCGNTSPSIEPFNSNAYNQKTENGTNLHKNKYLEALFDAKGISEEEKKKLWSSIITKQGSVQHLKVLTDEEKAVFKTAFEIDQNWIITHASDRQKYIDQAQSVNLFFKNPVDINVVHMLHYTAWKNGLKTLYYARSSKSNRMEDIGLKFDRHSIKEAKKTSTVLPNGMEISCVGCEG